MHVPRSHLRQQHHGVTLHARVVLPRGIGGAGTPCACLVSLPGTLYLAPPPSWRGWKAGRLRCGGSRFLRPSTLRTRTTRWWMAASTL